MKKIVLSIGLGLSLAGAAFAADDNTLEQLNAEVVNILAPYQNQATSAKLTFGAVETDSERAVKVSLNGLFNKIGPLNHFNLKLDNLSYNYGDGTKPTTVFKGSVDLDFTKLIPQDQINKMIPLAAEMVEQFAKSYSAEDYEDAASVHGVVTSTTVDGRGNYTGLSAFLSAKIDLAKLPERTPKDSVIATEVVVSLDINLKTGVKVDGYIVSNPAYYGFKQDEVGLKELLDKLLARDEDAMASIQSYAEEINRDAEYVVNGPQIKAKTAK